MVPQRAAQLPAGRAEGEPPQQGGQGLRRPAQAAQALGQVEAGLLLVFHPAQAPVQKLPELPGGLLLPAVGGQLPGVVKLLPGQEGAFRFHVFQNPQVPVRVPRACFFVGDRGVPVEDLPRRGDGLVDRALPDKARLPPQEPLPEVGEAGPARPVAPGVVGEHHHVRVRGQGRLQPEKPLPVLGEQYVVGVQPQAVVLGGLGKGEVPGGGKVVLPGEVVDQGRVPPRDLPGLVAAARIHDDHLLRQALYRLQAAGQGGFLVFYDHAQADGGHRRAPFRVCKGGPQPAPGQKGLRWWGCPRSG